MTWPRPRSPAPSSRCSSTACRFPSRVRPSSSAATHHNANVPPAGERRDELPRPVPGLRPFAGDRDAAPGRRRHLGPARCRRQRRAADLRGGGGRPGHHRRGSDRRARSGRLRRAADRLRRRRRPHQPAAGADHPPHDLDAQPQLVRRPAAETPIRAGRRPSSSRRPARSTRPSGRTSSTTSTSPSWSGEEAIKDTAATSRTSNPRSSTSGRAWPSASATTRPATISASSGRTAGGLPRHLHARRGLQAGNAAGGLRTSADAAEWLRGLVSPGHPGDRRQGRRRQPQSCSSGFIRLGHRRPRRCSTSARPRPWRRPLQRTARRAWLQTYASFEQFAKDNKVRRRRCWPP